MTKYIFFYKNAAMKIINKLPLASALLTKDAIIKSKNEPAQRSIEWLNKRMDCITASSCIICVKGKFFQKTLEEYIYEKINRIHTSIDNPAVKHGILFEPVATLLFEKLFNVKVHESALLFHKKYNFLGASTDGLYLQYDPDIGSIIGECLEIKVPFRRKDITFLPEYYYYQIQMQLEVLNLNVCKYFVCDIRKTNINTFVELPEANNGYIGGVIIEEQKDNSNKVNTYYLPQFYNYENETNFEKYVQKINKFIKSNNINGFYQVIYYIIKRYYIQEIFRDAKWFEFAFPYFENTFARIQLERKKLLEV